MSEYHVYITSITRFRVEANDELDAREKAALMDDADGKVIERAIDQVEKIDDVQ